MKTAAREILVVDPDVDDAGALLDGRRAGFDVLRLIEGGNALGQILRHLDGRRGITALHVLSHGEPGALRLAGERVDRTALAARPAALAAIAGRLAADAEVVLYGCSVAAGSVGRGFVDNLETSLGVAVAASAGPVGAGGARRRLDALSARRCGGRAGLHPGSARGPSGAAG